MINIEEIARLLTFENSLPIYNKKEDKFVFIKEDIDLSKDDNLIPLFEFTFDDLKYSMNKFIDENKNKYPNIVFINIKTFNDELRSNDSLYRDWINFFILSIDYEVYSWVKLNNLEESEASQEIYDEIKKEFDIYVSHHYEDIIPDTTLIGLYDYQAGCCFNIMGNSKVTYGLSFYFGMFDEQYFRLMQSCEMDLTNPFLEEIVSLYSEKDPNNRPFSYLDKYNPYSKNGTMSSIHLYRSGIEICYLTSSLGLLMIENLKLINLKLDSVFKSKEFNSIDLNYPSIVNAYAIDNKIEVFSFKDKIICPERFFYDIKSEIYIGNPVIKIKSGLSCDITFKRLDIQHDCSPDKRTSKISYVFLVCDHENLKVFYSLMIKGCNNPFEEICKKINITKGFMVGSRIYVNTLLDHELVTNLLSKEIKSNKVVINDTKERLTTDKYIKLLEDYMETQKEEYSRFN